jgi:hypothetical protein
MRKISRKGLKKKCWDLMSLWTRIKNADNEGYVKCVTCGKIIHYKEIDAGHLRHGVLDYDPMNIHPQCVYCNKFQSGQRDLYYQYVVKTYGQKEVDDMYQRASLAKKGELYTMEELEKIAIDLTLKTVEEFEKRNLPLPKKIIKPKGE